MMLRAYYVFFLLQPKNQFFLWSTIILLFRKVFRNQVLNSWCAFCYRGFICFYTFLVNRVRKYIYIPMRARIFIYFYVYMHTYIYVYTRIYMYPCMCVHIWIYFCIYLHVYFSKNEFILISPALIQHTEFILASLLLFIITSFSDSKKPGSIVCKLYTCLINPIRHVVSELLIHILLYFVLFFLLSLALWTQSKHHFPKLLRSALFFPLLDPILTFSKVFPHLALPLITSLLMYKGKKSQRVGCVVFSAHAEQSDSWLELGTSGFLLTFCGAAFAEGAWAAKTAVTWHVQ